MNTKVQQKKETPSLEMKKLLKSFLKLFIRIEIIPFSYDGNIRKHCTLYVFGIEICSNVYKTKY